MSLYREYVSSTHVLRCTGSVPPTSDVIPATDGQSLAELMAITSPSYYGKKSGMFLLKFASFFYGGKLSLDLSRAGNHPMVFAAMNDNLVELPINEDSYYADATSYLPSFVSKATAGGGVAATKIFKGVRLSSRANILLSGECHPEYNVTLLLGSVCFCGEAKSFDEVQLEEMSQYAAITMSYSLFSRGNTQSPPVFEFYDEPPLCFVILSVGSIGWIASIEWVGCLFYKFISVPFCLNSAAHAQAIDLVNILAGNKHFQPSMHLPQLPTGWSCAKSRPLVIFGQAVLVDRSVKFVKIVPINAFAPAVDYFKGPSYNDRYCSVIGEEFCAKWAPAATYYLHVFKVYNRLSEKLNEMAELVHQSVVNFHLKYGMFEVAIVGPVVGTRDATPVDFLTESFVDSIMEAVVWLAMNCGLLFIDIRPPNVRIDGDRVFLVDYDDCVLLDTNLCCGHRVSFLLQENEHSSQFVALSWFQKWSSNCVPCADCSARLAR